MATMTDLNQSPILVYPKLATLDRFKICGAMNNRLRQQQMKYLFGSS